MVVVDSPQSKVSWKRRNFGVRCRKLVFLVIGLVVAATWVNDTATGLQLVYPFSSPIAYELFDTAPPSVLNVNKSRHYHVCNKPSLKKKYGPEWVVLCEGELLVSSERLLQHGQVVHLVQIGAHVGFEGNDPFANGISSYLNSLGVDEKQRFHWHFVEPSPPNYDRLMQNLAKHSDLCDMRGINKAVVPDSFNSNQKDSLEFYSISKDIDPETGYDSRSGKYLPRFVTQLSSFSMSPLTHNKGVFRKQSLKIKDYIVKTKVSTSSYSELMREIMGGSNDVATTESRPTLSSMFTLSSKQGTKIFDKPLFVLIDTEGFDCNIICGISETSSFWPPFLIYEHTQCSKEMKMKTVNHLRSLGYKLTKIPRGQNTVAIRKPAYREI